MSAVLAKQRLQFCRILDERARHDVAKQDMEAQVWDQKAHAKGH